MRRRTFIQGVAASTASPLAARAEPPPLPVIGFLYAGSPASGAHFVTAFRKGLSETGYAEGQNVLLEYHYGEGHYDQLAMQATDFAGRKVSVIIAGGGTVAARAASSATSTIPIVFIGGGDPVREGLVNSLNHPGNNITGVNQFSSVLIAKRLQLLHELVPNVSAIGALANTNNPNSEAELNDLRNAAAALALSVRVVSAAVEQEITTAFEELVTNRVGALVVGTDAFFVSQRAQIISLAAQRKLPASYTIKEYTESGGLMSYGANRADLWHQVGIYAGRILKGEKPADLPVLQPTKFELTINLKTAKALGIIVPTTLLSTADEVIE
jgi:putative tryptophan/tyrosine transport system substrate-binding protein